MNWCIPFTQKVFVRIHFLLIILLLGNACQISATEFAITAKSGSAGRLGDEILMYSTAKWLAYKYDIPFYVTPFKNSNHFSIHSVDKLLDAIPKNFLSHAVEISSEDELILYLKEFRAAQKDTLFVVTYQMEIHFASKLVLEGRWPDKYINLYAQSRQHPAFCTNLKAALAPSPHINKLSLPKDRVTVAVHIRKGSGGDAEVESVQYIDEWEFINSHAIHIENPVWGIERGNPFRFPPEQFYVDQILNLANLLNYQPMLVYIFTDDKNPMQLLKRLKMRIPLPNIVFDFNKQNVENRAVNDNAIIEDLCNMAQFDCLIKPESGFSAAAQLIGNHKMVIYPQIIMWHTNPTLNQSMLQITGSGIIFYNNNTHTTSYRNLDEITKEHKQIANQLF